MRISPFSGGVSARGATVPGRELGELAAPSPAAPTDANFGYEGGPVIVSPRVYASFWGPLWSDEAHRGEREALVQFLQDFLASSYMNILSQYGVGKGAGQCGTWEGVSELPAVNGSMTDSDIHNAIQSLINAGSLPEPGTPSEVALMIFLDERIEIRDSQLGVVMCEPNGDNAFGYHNHFTTAAGNPFYYSVVPALDQKCLEESCPEGGCSLSQSLTQLQRRTQVASHEFSEMVTDPEINAWRDRNSGEENGDVCNGRSTTINVSGREWTVQQMYSHATDLKGEPACIAGAPAPIPPLPT
jgi:hypothetical protein